MTDFLRFWPVLLVLGNLLALWLMWSLRQSFVSRAEYEQLAGRVGACEARHASAVTRADLARVTDLVGEVTAASRVLQSEILGLHRRIDEALPRIERAIERIEQHLMEAS